jgi:di-heme oxidoreductase (putative peroxidase)
VSLFGFSIVVTVVLCWAAVAPAQLLDQTQQPNAAREGIAKSLAQQIGPPVPSPGHGSLTLPETALFLINRDPFRAIKRGRQLFQRKFTQTEGLGPRLGDGVGDLATNLDTAAGLSDSCAGCHGRPRGAAGAGGVVATRPDSRDAPHLFGLGLKEMLADEITTDLRAIQTDALVRARTSGQAATAPLQSKGISYGVLTVYPNGVVDTAQVQGVNHDLRVRPFLAHGGKISIREFVVGALQAEMGLQAVDPDLLTAHNGGRVTTPSGMVLDGSLDQIEAPPTDDCTADPDGDGVVDEVPTSLVDFLEFYLLNYFKPATYEQTSRTARGRALLESLACTSCHIPALPLTADRRVADVETDFDPTRGGFNGLFATATPLYSTTDDGAGWSPLKRPLRGPFLVADIFTDFKRHDLGPNFYERNYDGTLRTEFITPPLWGVGTTAPYGHDGRSINLREVILRHGGEALASTQAFAQLPAAKQREVVDYLNSLVLFPPDDTASNLNPPAPNTPNFPQFGHGSLKLSELFNNPMDTE